MFKSLSNKIRYLFRKKNTESKISKPIESNLELIYCNDYYKINSDYANKFSNVIMLYTIILNDQDTINQFNIFTDALDRIGFSKVIRQPDNNTTYYLLISGTIGQYDKLISMIYYYLTSGEYSVLISDNIFFNEVKNMCLNLPSMGFYMCIDYNYISRDDFAFDLNFDTQTNDSIKDPANILNIFDSCIDIYEVDDIQKIYGKVKDFGFTIDDITSMCYTYFMISEEYLTYLTLSTDAMQKNDHMYIFKEKTIDLIYDMQEHINDEDNQIVSILRHIIQKYEEREWIPKVYSDFTKIFKLPLMKDFDEDEEDPYESIDETL